MVLLDQSETALRPSFTWPSKPELGKDEEDLVADESATDGGADRKSTL